MLWDRFAGMSRLWVKRESSIASKNCVLAKTTAVIFLNGSGSPSLRTAAIS